MRTSKYLEGFDYLFRAFEVRNVSFVSVLGDRPAVGVTHFISKSGIENKNLFAKEKRVHGQCVFLAHSRSMRFLNDARYIPEKITKE